MKVNIVTVQSGWILQTIANKIHKELSILCDCSISHAPDLNVDINYYVDIQNCFLGKTNTIDVGFFTHLDKNSLASIRHHWLSIDFIIHQTQRYYDIFKDFYKEDKMIVLSPGEVSSNFSLKKPKLGIFQRGGFEGKGHSFVKKLIETDISKEYSYLFVGKGWDDVVEKMKNLNMQVDYQFDESYDQYPNLYSKIDYLLIPSLWEGGPMSVLESLSMGIPIISSNVGWVGNKFIPEYIYEPNNLEQLESILIKIMEPLKKRRKQVEDMNYGLYSKKLMNIFEKLV